MHQGILSSNYRVFMLLLFPSQILTNATTAHVRIMQHVSTVREATSVLVQPALRVNNAQKVKMQILFLVNLCSLVYN